MALPLSHDLAYLASVTTPGKVLVKVIVKPLVPKVSRTVLIYMALLTRS